MPTANAPARDIAAERARIDIAMAQLETAKQKATAQRAEYAKYLTWKTNLQRKERKQREEEEDLLRQRVEEKLGEILQLHKEHRRQELNQYRHFANKTAGKPVQPKIANSYEKEAQIVAEAEMEKERRRSEWMQTQKELSRRNRSAPASMNNTKQNKASSGSTFRPMQPHAPLAPAPPALDTDGSEKFDPALMDQKKQVMENLLRSAGPIRHGNQNAPNKGATAAASSSCADEEPLDPNSIDAQLEARDRRRQESEQIKKKVDRVKDRTALMEAMYLKARTRRMYAQGRIAADPPADYLVGTDIFKYIPAELIPGGAGGQASGLPGAAGGGAAGDAFFLTEMGEDGRVREDGDGHQPRIATVRGKDGDLVTLTVTSSPRRRRLQQALGKSTNSGSDRRALVQERFPEEEAAMYAHHVALTQQNQSHSSKHRSVVVASTSMLKSSAEGENSSPGRRAATTGGAGGGMWERHSKFKLPPVNSIRFVDK